ncbi:hypothetical protein [Glaciecola sp. KUL10]|uniref:hypothetical protein n=1 Tax=Glaciecola sp. (strain KUL10) TaxID=2161813 RepID=UPI000D89D926|nr:hypothetical protein [Glaciecola sp. KUL10]GBL05336.1 sulfatase AtsG [Glaciecola sp. KUL10]
MFKKQYINKSLLSPCGSHFKSILLIAIFALGSCVSQNSAIENSAKHTLKDESLPNIVLILSDDQAWNDYSFMGHDVI